MNPAWITHQAQLELRAEAERRAIDLEKIKILRRRTFWSRIFPFVITITRKNP